MKRYAVILAMAACLLAVSAAASDYTFESTIDPMVFPQWEMVFAEPGPNGIAVLVKNPDATAQVKVAALFVHPSGIILSYVYLVNGEAVQFLLDGDCYKKTPLATEAKVVLEKHLKQLSGMVSL